MEKLKNLLKTLMGVPMGIFTLEVLNIIVSLQRGEYTRLDGLANGINLNSVILTYVYCSIYSYMIMVFINTSLEEHTKVDVPLQERKKQINRVGITIMTLEVAIFLVIMLIDANNYENIFGMCATILWSSIVMLVESIINLLNKHSVKEINETLKKAFKE